ncbi:MAG: RNA-guided endonuclease TnpB family protein [Candidatus Hermodarchaeota archaeon]
MNVRVYPNKEQRAQIRKTIGCSRFIYNQMLNERKEVYEQLKEDKNALRAYAYKTENQYKMEFPFLKEADSIALQASREHLYEAYQNFFNGLKKSRKVGFPKFKSKKGKESYTTKQTNGNIKIDFERKKLKLPKLRWLKFKDNRIFSEKIKRATVKKTKSNKYFVSLTLEAPEDAKELQEIREKKIIAFDMSVKRFLINNVDKLENPRFYRQEQNKTKKLNRELSRKKNGSKNREKTRLKLARHYEKIYNRKKDWTHKLTPILADSFDAIILENLNLKGMQRFNSDLSKSVSLDFSWHQFTTYLKYKMEWLGKHLVFVDRFFASSKLCSRCGWKNNNLTLGERAWTCEICGTTHEKDENASINLRKEGIRILKELKHITIIHNDKPTVGTTGSHAFGDDVRPQEIFRDLLGQFSRKKESTAFRQ